MTGQLLTDPATPDSALRPDIDGQAEMCLGNLSRILAHAGYGFTDAVFVKIYLKEFERDFRGFNTVYASIFWMTRRSQAEPPLAWLRSAGMRASRSIPCAFRKAAERSRISEGAGRSIRSYDHPAFGR